MDDIANQQRFTVDEWNLAKYLKLNNSETVRLDAQRLLADSARLREETVKNAKILTDDANKRLEQRIEDVDYWRSEVNMRQVGISQEIDSLGTYFTRFDNAKKAYEHPLSVTKQCLILRDQREGIDLTHDEVQENLLKEIEVVLGVQQMLSKTYDDIKEQLRLNRKTRYRLEHDLSDKTVAMKLDSLSANLRPYSHELLANDGTCLEPYEVPRKQSSFGTATVCDKEAVRKKVSIHEWRRITNAVVAKAEGELNQSIQFRGLLESILSQVSYDIRFQLTRTNQAFEHQIQETRATKTKLEQEHAELERQIGAMEENLEGLQQSIALLEVPLTLAQTRLSVRDARPNTEYCFDPATERLTSELRELDEARESLRDKIRHSEQSLHQMMKIKLELMDDIKIKGHTLYIDEVQCMALRKTVSIQQH